ncbi:MAG: DUF1653 domain-containing protein [Clostridia bacterium]|nr:DUF1653 domain-containing protein [Clostridia bacterium]
MEIWDLYDKDRRLTGETLVRGTQGPEGRYHLVVDVLFLNSKGETLLQRRAKDKEPMPDIWSVTGGSAIAGEDSAAAVVRETEEEMGFSPDMAHGKILMTERRERKLCGFFRDVWLIRQDVPIEQMRWQEGEVQDGMWILPEKIAADPDLWRQLCELYFWKEAYPYLCLESMRIRIPKGVYRHYKGNRYEVQGLALHSETLEPMVIYRALYGHGEVWTRPASMWNEKVTLPDGTNVQRFQRENDDRQE